MSIYKDAELKDAVLNLAPREKDKLLIRLINKDKLLVKQLHYRLLEDEHDLLHRIETLKEKLNNIANADYLIIKNTTTTASIKNMLSLLRQQNALINEHEKVTKDMFSVVDCRFSVLELAFNKYPAMFQQAPFNGTDKIRKYSSTQLRITLKKLDQLHEDLQFDIVQNYEATISFATEHSLC